jgi:hypothetical protein
MINVSVPTFSHAFWPLGAAIVFFFVAATGGFLLMISNKATKVGFAVWLVLIVGAFGFLIGSANAYTDAKSDYRAQVAQALHDQVGATFVKADTESGKAPTTWAKDEYEMVLKVDGVAQHCITEVKEKTDTTVGLLVSCSDSTPLPLVTK